MAASNKMSAVGRRGVWQNTDWRELGLLLLFLVLILLLWNTWTVYPLKILVVFFHELSHAIAAFVTGGSVVEIRIEAQEGGMCVVRGGNNFLLTSAGYLGSLCWGGVLLLLARRAPRARVVAASLGMLLVAVSLLFIRPLIGFGFLFALVSGAVIAVLALRLPPWVSAVFLKIAGLTSCLYALLDIKADIIDHPLLPTDAQLLAQATGIPALLWGLIWLGIALPVTGAFLLAATRKKHPPVFKAPD
jgi:hypothetical protein